MKEMNLTFTLTSTLISTMTIFRATKLLLLGGLFAFTLPVFSAEEDSRPWPSELFDEINETMIDLDDELQDQGERFRASIFESLTDIDEELWENDRAALGLKLRRRVYDNYDILDSYTVIDLFQIPITLTYPLADDVDLGGSFNGVKAKFKTTLSMNAMNIRQVYPEGLENLRSMDQIEQQATDQLANANNPDDTGTGDSDVGDGNDDGDDDDDGGLFDNIGKILSWNIENPLFKARYKNLLNLLTHPFRLPLTESGLKNMNIGEISRHGLSGVVELSAGIGWGQVDLSGAGVDGELNIGADVSTYLKGNFNISVMKESEEQVLLKLGRQSGRGIQGSLGINAPDHQIFEGFIVLDQEVLEVEESVIPFHLRVSKDKIRSFDIGYRYDLSVPEAKKAYFKATFGKLKLSEKLAKKDKGVEKVFTRYEDEDQVNSRYRMELSLIFEKEHRNSRRVSEVKVTLDGKEHHFFKAHNIDQRGYSASWNDAERRRYEFQTTFDAGLSPYEQNGAYLSLESSITDQYTNGYEFRRYVKETELMTGQTDLFPDVPMFPPKVECEDFDFTPWVSRSRRRDLRGNFDPQCQQIRNNTSYGKTHFYYRLGLDYEQIRKFVHIPQKEMWGILEAAFGIGNNDWSTFASRFAYVLRNSYATALNAPLLAVDGHIEDGGNLFQAWKFYGQWKDLKEYESPERLAEAFSKMLDSSFHNFQLMKVFKFALPEEEFSYQIRASADRVFGHISKEGGVIEDLDTISDRARRLIDFDRHGPRNEVDSEARVQSFNVEILDKNTVALDIHLKTTPEFVYFRADRTSSWKFFKNYARFIVKNKGRFKKGKNRILIERDGDDQLSELLSDAIFRDEWITISTAMSRDGENWGAVATEEIKVRIDDDDNDKLTTTVIQ